MLNVYNKEYDQRIAQNRQLFLKDNMDRPKEIRKDIYESWLRCKEAGLRPDHQLKKTTHQALDKLTSVYIREHVLAKEVKSLYKILTEFNAVIYYINSDEETIFSQRGSAVLLRELDEKGFGIGTDISEGNIGTTAIVLPKSEHGDAWVIGEEHYNSKFTPYATYIYHGDYYAGLQINSFVIIPKESFTNLFIYFMREYNEKCKNLIIAYLDSLNFKLKEVLYKQFEQTNEQGIMLLDPLGKILSINDKLASWLQVDSQVIKEKDYNLIFPELEEFISRAKDGKSIQFEEVQLKKLKINMQHVRINIMPVLDENHEIDGIIISFLDKKKISNLVNKLANSKAFYDFDSILGESKAIQEAKNKAINAARGFSPIIITGESGSGKELFAQAIHNESPVKDGPFVAVNCAAIVPELIASELFGYVEGAFTGSRKGGSMGKFEYAHKGTLFLDEIGELSMSVQAILLRVLEEKKITRVGSNTEISIDVRLITATNRDLKKMVKERTFRLDLYYRIYVIDIHLPALKERAMDIPILADYFISYFNSIYKKNIKTINQDALGRLVSYSWPGNVRELRNVIECGMNNSYGNVLKLSDLPNLLENTFEEDTTAAYMQQQKEDNEFNINERQRILSMMIAYNGNKSKVAESMGISRSTLYKKMEQYSLL